MTRCWTGLLLLALAGCGSAPPSLEYYLLDNTGAAQALPVNANRTAVSLLPLLLPDYLRQDGLVMQVAPHKLHVSRRHLWAQSLASSLSMALLRDVNGSDSQYVLRNLAEPGTAEAPYQLKVQILHLLIDQQSNIQLEARYWLLDSNESKTLRTGAVQSSLPLEEDGYGHAVAKMREAVAILSRDIQAQLSTLETSGQGL
ncbi:PqiC family protein [Bowmanella dokdonensis]|uniref:Membrane integrity-associated transporter subunit PqiC n=1 Tax=Bowmanella dokdonensis TaxID=751969 RepID=A0A939DPK4_9ALTE|nr:ABC-type transport auxiliary lipoprotein family protein [Bowmanella dokdonensis]MBN7826389.1 membrane integrity-associated transporter subunit PqiC [Bowmanella dokdonensis]